MKKRIEEIGGYIANNPFISKEPVKHWFMRNSFSLYKKLRIMISKCLLLTGRKNYIRRHEGAFHRKRETNAAVDCINIENKKAGQPYFYIEFLSILELIPKEQMNNVISGIEKFKKKHADERLFVRHIEDAGYFQNFFGGDAYSFLGGLSIKDKSKLRKYIKQINLQTVNITDSFCCLNVIVILNPSLKRELSSFLISDVPDQHRISGYENKRWYQIRNLGEGIISGEIHKQNILEEVITDIKWSVMKELSKHINYMVFQSQSNKTPCVSSIITNIDGNSNSAFWSSLGIDSEACDFCSNMSACIAWRRHGNSPFYIYSKDSKNGLNNVRNSNMSYYIGCELSAYLIAECVDISIRKKLTKYSFNISRLKNKNIRYWLKSKVKSDTEMFYEVRFVSEYKHLGRESDFEDFNRLIDDKPVIVKLYSDIENRIKDTKRLYEHINGLYQSHIDYRVVESNYQMQCTVLITSIVSAVVAVVAIVISLLSSESAINFIVSSWICIKNILKNIGKL